MYLEPIRQSLPHKALCLLGIGAGKDTLIVKMIRCTGVQYVCASRCCSGSVLKWRSLYGDEMFAQPIINEMDCFNSAAPASGDLCKTGDTTISMINLYCAGVQHVCASGCCSGSVLE